ncbi:hypothetical protein TNCV_2918181 [Trichonephila clavipes]|nr:hypothetical protein TNCV_2918181 [Trichonephila clavipes]
MATGSYLTQNHSRSQSEIQEHCSVIRRASHTKHYGKAAKNPSSRESSREEGGREERWEVSDYLQRVLPQNWGGTEPKRTVTCMTYKAKVTSGLCRDEFRGPRSDNVSGISNNNISSV